MTTAKFQEIKTDLLHSFGNSFCEEALQTVQNARTAKQLITVLHKYAFEIWKYKYISTDWVRRWFSNEQPLLQACHCYLDQPISLTNPDSDIVCFGKCRISIVLTKPQRIRVFLQDDTHVNICTYGVCLVSLYVRDNASVSTAYQSKLSIIKTHIL